LKAFILDLKLKSAIKSFLVGASAFRMLYLYLAHIRKSFYENLGCF